MIKYLIIGSGRNCALYIEKFLASLDNQVTSEKFHALLIDDNSEDNTTDILREWSISKTNVIDVRTTQRRGLVAARDGALAPIGLTGKGGFYIKNFDKDTVLIWVDMDDELLPNAVQTVIDIYEKNPNVWLTYGNFTDQGGNMPFPDGMGREWLNDPRGEEFKFTPLRTFKYGLYQQLTHDDKFPTPPFECYPDANMLLCMVEMAGPERCVEIKEPIYKYNMTRPDNVAGTYSEKQREEERTRFGLIEPKKKIDML